MSITEPARVVALISGAGSNLRALLDADLAGELGGRVVLVVSDRAEAGGLDLARSADVATHVVLPSDHPDRAAWDAALAEVVIAADPDVVVLAGFMRILGPELPGRFPTLNVHPSLLPAFPGAKAVEAALDWGVKVTGCTVHLVDEQVDHGPVIAQEAVLVMQGDTSAKLHARIRAVEHRLLPACVALACRGRLLVDGRHVEVRQT